MQVIHPARTSFLQRRALALATFAVVSLGATACGGDSVGPLGGTGSLTTTGAVSTSGSGLALFQSFASGGQSLFQVMVAPINLGQTGSTPAWQLQIVSYTGRPAVGTYALSALSASSTNPTANFYWTTGGTTMDLYNSTSGQLVITSSSTSEVKGTFTFTAANTAGGTATVTATGSFHAQCVPGMDCI